MSRKIMRKGITNRVRRYCYRRFSFPVTPGKVSLVIYMAFFTSAITTLKTLVVAIGAGLGVWGVINLLEGYGNDNPGAKSQGIKQLMAGAGIMLLGTTLIPQLATLFG